MTVIAPAALDPATKSALRIGLLASALPMPDVRWQGGISYRPLNSNVPTAPNSTFYPCTAGLGIDSQTTTPVSWEAFGIALRDDCLSGSTDEDEEQLRAEARLRLQTEYLVSRTFWTGEVAASTFAALGAPNRALSDLDSEDLTTTGAVGVVTAFSRAIQYLADTIGSERGMIHVAPSLIPFMAFYGVAVRLNETLIGTSIGDHLIVPGAGYDGSAPDGSAAGVGTTWIYATSMVRATVSPISTFPYLNRSHETNSNQWETYAQRLAIAEWDLQAHGALQVCIPDPGASCLEVPS